MSLAPCLQSISSWLGLPWQCYLQKAMILPMILLLLGWLLSSNLVQAQSVRSAELQSECCSECCSLTATDAANCV